MNCTWRQPPETTPYLIDGKLNAPKGLLVLPSGERIGNYTFTGEYDGEALRLDFNDRVELEWSGPVRITGHDIGFNLPLLLDELSASGAEAESQGDEKPGSVEAEATGAGSFELDLEVANSFIWLDPHRRIPAEKSSLSYRDGRVDARLEYGEGVADFHYVDQSMNLEGSGFTSDFFDPFITLAEFEGGTLDFEITGTGEKMDAVFSIQNTIVKDYKHLKQHACLYQHVAGAADL